MPERWKAVHFVGVGGSGMSPLAEILLRRGMRISGSDLKASSVTAYLESLGLEFHEGHAAGHVGAVDVVVRSSAVRPSNPEIQEAERRDIPVILRGALLAELMASSQGVAVAGAHGKTTTTAMLGLVLDRAGLDPTVVIGGRFAAFGSHARVGRSGLLVAEADESDRSFLWLRPHVAIVTNIDHEHLESYGTFDDLTQAFARFAESVPNEGAAVLCIDDAPVMALSETIAAPVISYGIDHRDAAIGAADVMVAGYGAQATILRRSADGRDSVLGTLTLQVPGRHNVLNALAVVAAASHLGVSLPGHRGGVGRIPRRRAPFRTQGRGERSSGRGRLRPSSNRNRRGIARCPSDRRRPGPVRVPAASLLAHRASAARLRAGACARR